jgi:hypothetical protein
LHQPAWHHTFHFHAYLLIVTKPTAADVNVRHYLSIQRALEFLYKTLPPPWRQIGKKKSRSFLMDASEHIMKRTFLCAAMASDESINSATAPSIRQNDEGKKETCHVRSPTTRFGPIVSSK